VLRFVDSEPGADAPAAGSCLPLGGSFCARVLDGRFPALIPDARAVPDAALLDVTAALHIGSYIGVPLVSAHGTAVGMLCAISDTATPGMSERDVASLHLIADLLRDVQRRAQSDAELAQAEAQLRFVLQTVVAGRGRYPVLQPVVDLQAGRAVAAEGLTRFTLPGLTGGRAGTRSPAQWFHDAGRLGLRAELELAAAASLLDRLDDDDVPRDVAITVNLCPATVTGGGLPALLAGRDLGRVVVELTEHAPVTDYPALAAALRPHRDRGLRVAVDDIGAGYASLRHVLDVDPDLVKVDMALVRSADTDLARRAMLSGLVRFAATVGCRVVAEGVETQAELHAVAGCGVTLVQGYLTGPPERSPSWDAFPGL
jgi:EAL domain-containing protein (putative c-di-GMP-specific phosphodiesterase class I)